MEIIKRKENYKNPIVTAQKNFRALGIILTVIGLMFLLSGNNLGGILVIAYGIFSFIIFLLLRKRNVWGVYLGWVYCLTAIFPTISNLLKFKDLASIISLVITLYLLYWNYKAHQSFKNISS
jgi:hypothetical protein